MTERPLTDAFDRLVAALDPAMIVVTTAADGERAGCLVGFHSQCSIEPARYAVWLSKANHTFRVALRAEFVAVHVLTDDQHDLAAAFGTRSGDDVDKFAGLEWTEGPAGVPLLAGCEGRFVGRRRAMVEESSDHVILILEPVEAAGGDGADDVRPLRLSAVTDLEPGHGAGEHPRPEQVGGPAQ